MKLLRNVLGVLIVSLLALSACKKDTYSLGDLPAKADLKFEIIQDKSVDAGGNTIILINKTPGIVPIWDYGTGKSNRERDTIHIAFQGNYTIKFAAMAGAGIVEADPVNISVTQDNLNYVSDPMWFDLTGGPGKEKTWVLDLGGHGIFDGPVYYYAPAMTWVNFHNDTADQWWAPAWKDNTWIIPEADKASTMTFSLIGGPYMKTHKVTEGVNESGTFFLNADGKTLTTSGATILRSKDFIANAANWNTNLVILTLTENQLQVGVRRTNSEGDCLYVWNFISKTYADGYVPPPSGPKLPDEGYAPQFGAGELLTMITGPTGFQSWQLDAAGNPIDWIGAGNGWTADAKSSWDWGWNQAWDDIARNSWIRFEKNGMKYFRNQNGALSSGTFSVNEATNEVTLINNKLIENTASSLSPASSTFKVVKAFPGEAASRGIWFGTAYVAEKDEWFVFHYTMQ